MKFNLKNTENTIVLGLFLAVLGLIAAVVIAYMSAVTKGPIDEAALAETVKSLQQLLPEFDNRPVADFVAVKDADGNDVVFYRAFAGGKLVGVAGENLSRKGYAGDIVGLVSLTPDGNVRSVLIKSHSETPGLGAAVCTRRDAKTIFSIFQQSERPGNYLPANPILDQFAGRAAGEKEWKIARDGGEFDSITGSTVTCRAVTDLVYRTARAFELNRAAIVDAPEKR